MITNRRYIVVGVLFLLSILVIFAGFTVLQSRKFRVVEVSPQNILPDSQDKITVTFNRTLKSIEEQNESFVQLNTGEAVDVVIEDTKMSITLRQKPAVDTEITISVASILATSGETLTTDLSYVVRYVPFSDLPAELQEYQLNSSSITGDANPLLSQLPYDALAYKVSALIDNESYVEKSNWRDEKDSYAVLIETFVPSEGLTTEQYKEQQDFVRGLAKKWIAELGVDPDKDINVVFSPSDDDINGIEDIGD